MNIEHKRYTFEELHNDETLFRQIPDCAGIYKIYRPHDFQMIFRDDSDANAKTKDKSVLENKWEQILCHPGYEENLLYIGKGINLRRRIRQYVATGYGAEKPNHCGGRVIFQLQNNKKLEIEFFVCENCREVKKQEIEKYLSHRGVFPLANWQR